ncbi:hypothetical protein IW492_05735 [Enterococcus sp. BWB1-3]|uniref:hypothetical protein n=1 Tax=Enterococcus sp. BWB1-3 TaxID=2787713 RepID=UPI001921D879|nr:hypothetical protein [Enterococcus sp. BWB1-3]MBL1228733.1 hypothetical protein [Enterococcus sp. BWB1-3]
MSKFPSFKAYHEDSNTIRDVLCIDYLNETVDLSGGLIEILFSDTVLLRGSGVEDINGVEMFDSDRCILYGRFGKQNVIILEDINGNLVAALEDESCCYQLTEWEMEVIGNEYVSQWE